MELSDIQGLVFYGYAQQPLARYYLVSFAKDAEPQAWLSRLVHRVSSADSAERGEASRLNVAFSARGLERLGLGEETMFTFQREFHQGMAHPERSIALGDFGDDAPQHWEFGGPAGPSLDALLMLFCPTQALLDERHAEIDEALSKHGLTYTTQDAYIPADGREHFGFADGLTNPVVKGGPVKHDKNPFDPPIKAGELLLGHRNAYGKLPFTPVAPLKRSTRDLPPRKDGGVDLGFNGTYLVVRKLEQDVKGFWAFAHEQAEKAGADDAKAWSTYFAARLVGRWPNGMPLVGSPTNQDPPADLNTFGYRELDQDGLRCPIGAHVRRTNPRDTLGEDGPTSLVRSGLHRITRRGRLYQETERQGLLFIALNANLRRQFEFIQQTWINNSKFGGLCSDRDPLVGNGYDIAGERVQRIFTRALLPVRERCVGLPSFVRMRGGGYFFLPSLRALSYLAEA
jgi:Dyp-type peroxidase family